MERTFAVLAVHDLEIRVGARVLMSDVSFRVSDGDKIGLVGRNGAGKTTLTKVLAGDLLPADGKVERWGELGYLPQDPRSGDPEMLARTRILDARGLGTLALGMYEASVAMGDDDPAVAARAMRKYGNLTEKFESARRLHGRGGGRVHRAQPLAARPHPRPAAQDALGRPATTHRVGADPVL